MKPAILLFILSHLSLFAQAQQVDSLEWKLTQASNAEERVTVLLEGYHRYRQDSLALANEFLKKAKREVNQVTHASVSARLFVALGNSFYDSRSIDSSQWYYKKALDIYVEQADSSAMALVLADIGLNHYSQNQFQKAMDYYLRALKIQETAGDKAAVIDLNSRMAFILIQQEQFNQAIDYLKRNLAAAKRANADVEMVKGAFNIANVLKRSKQPEQALQYCDSTILFASAIGMEFGIAKANGMKAYVLLDMKRPDEALGSIEIAEGIFQKMDARIDLFQLTIARARVAQERERFEEMWKLVQTAADQSGDIQDNELLIELYDARHVAAKNTRRFEEALLAHEKMMVLKDSVFKLSNAEKINQLLTQYETEKKDRAIEQLEYDRNLQDLKLAQRNTQLVIAGVLVLLVVMIGFLVLQKRKFDQQQAVNNLEQRMLRLQMNPHFIFNALASIQNFVLHNEPAQSVKYLAKFSQLMRQILEHSREEFITLGEEMSMLRNYLDIQQLRSDVPFQYAIECDDQLDPEAVMIPPLFAQPFVENAIEHGIRGRQDGRIVVRFVGLKDVLRVEIEDNGAGMQAENKHTKQHKSLATTITRERLAILGKGLDRTLPLNIASDKAGTRVQVVMPAKW